MSSVDLEVVEFVDQELGFGSGSSTTIVWTSDGQIAEAWIDGRRATDEELRHRAWKRVREVEALGNGRVAAWLASRDAKRAGQSETASSSPAESVPVFPAPEAPTAEAILTVVEIEAACARANAVRNMMAVWKGTLLRPDVPHDSKREAFEKINSGWVALQRHDLETWNRVLLMRAVDAVAKGNGAVGAAAGGAVLDDLPPELVERLEPHREALGGLVGAWHRTKPGAPSKFARFAEVWKAATGAVTTPDSWKALWKSVARRERPK